MICKCGYQNEPDDLYCAQCGRKLSPGKKGGKGWIIAIVVVLVLAAGAVAAFFLIPREPAEDPEETQEESINKDEVHDSEAVTPEDIKDSEEQTPPANGWDQERLFYYVDGEAVKGLQKIEGLNYYFDAETGEKQTGWVEIESAWHFFSEEGPALNAGWYSDDKGWFYLEEDGKHQTVGPIPDEENKKEYRLDDEGYLQELRYLELICILDKAEVDGRERKILKPMEQLSCCKKLTFTVTDSTGGITAMDEPIEQIWIRVNGVWTVVSENAEKQGEGTYQLTFDDAASFDAICIFVGQDQTVSPTLKDVVVSYK